MACCWARYSSTVWKFDGSFGGGRLVPDPRPGEGTVVGGGTAISTLWLLLLGCSCSVLCVGWCVVCGFTELLVRALVLAKLSLALLCRSPFPSR